MNTNFKTFLNLHHQSEPLLIGNVWNTQSAKVLEKVGFKALATSSAAVAETLGYADGEEIPFEEYLFVAKHITRSTSLPVSVDLEGGYAPTAKGVVNNLKKLYDVGVVGVNIEDSHVKSGSRGIKDAKEFSAMLNEVTAGLQKENIEMFINVRCDAFLLGIPNAAVEAIERGKMYEQTGVHGLFFPCITKEEDIQNVVSHLSLPVNVMCMPDLPDFRKLKTAGVRRISMGNFYNKKIYQELEMLMSKTMNEGNFGSVFAN